MIMLNEVIVEQSNSTYLQLKQLEIQILRKSPAELKIDA